MDGEKINKFRSNARSVLSPLKIPWEEKRAGKSNVEKEGENIHQGKGNNVSHYKGKGIKREIDPSVR